METVEANQVSHFHSQRKNGSLDRTKSGRAFIHRGRVFTSSKRTISALTKKRGVIDNRLIASYQYQHRMYPNPEPSNTACQGRVYSSVEPDRVFCESVFGRRPGKRSWRGERC